MNDNRSLIIQIAIVVVGLIYLVHLFSIQVLDDTYKVAAENNAVQRLTEYPSRGLISDRNGELIVVNDPMYDLMVVPKEVEAIDTLRLISLLGISQEDFTQKMEAAIKFSWVKPSVFYKQLSVTDYARIQDALVDFKGFYVIARTVRSYPEAIAANALGYIGEINKSRLERDTTGYYKQGDYIGISGLESYYEEFLRGKRGVKYRLVNVRGIEKGAFKDGEYDTLPIPGEDITTTIDLKLQQYGEKLMEGKVGSIVAIEPQTGEILSIISAPDYDPNLLTGRDYSANFNVLQNDSLVPLFNRPIMATYPPGSMFKSIQALIALQEKVLYANEQVFCEGNLIGDHAPPGYYDVRKAIMLSSNNYFVKVFRRVINQNVDPNTFIDSRIGLEKWRDYISRFGLGAPLDIDIPNGKGGFVPTLAYYDRYYGENRWKFSTIMSLSIGQGELLVTPIQMANFAAIIANKGYYYTPHLVKDIGKGEIPISSKYTTKNYTGIDSVHYEVVIEAMADVVKSGTGQYRAKLKDIEVCGKTSTVQNPHGEDHSGFIAFAPRENPQIAIAVYVENAGQGARAAAAIASLMIEKYLKGQTDRPWIEDYVLKGYFGD
ncbi:penicillin-binding protein 2 [Cytophagales bacterium LB-30]|uniref:Penicillin-binding protein 2 n=1 Tax=Shiella aurantiaca TaxID=3058365 RepID=A0ABT8F2E0_9BACT|nr:penicillin-binding protein 2 [Shiella aurantiaca]MDN4164605.1 penicillin-binding protein 2 [Shiella aurantiaca]